MVPGTLGATELFSIVLYIMFDWVDYLFKEQLGKIDVKCGRMQLERV